MHDAVIEFVRKFATEDHVRILDLGGRRTSTSRYYSGPQPYELFPNHSVYLILDQVPGPDVDIVADATCWTPQGPLFDIVICTEVLEHVQSWIKVLVTTHIALRRGGRLILTCGGPGRRPHPATSEDMDPPPNEFYGNVPHQDLRRGLEHIGYREIMTYQIGLDTQATAVK